MHSLGFAFIMHSETCTIVYVQTVFCDLFFFYLTWFLREIWVAVCSCLLLKFIQFFGCILWSMVSTFHSLFALLPVDGHLGCFQYFYHEKRRCEHIPCSLAENWQVSQGEYMPRSGGVLCPPSPSPGTLLQVLREAFPDLQATAGPHYSSLVIHLCCLIM